MSKRETETKRPSAKRAFLEWGGMLAILAFLYLTGLHTEVVGRLQQVLLATGVLQPDLEQVENLGPADYNLSLTTLDGERTSLASFEGKTIFLNFWATWCPPCIAEMPNIQSLYEKVGDQEHMVFVMVSVDETVDEARAFVEARSFDFPVYMLAGRVPQAYYSTTVPTTFVISPDGRIVARHEGMANYDTRAFRAFLDGLNT